MFTIFALIACFIVGILVEISLNHLPSTPAGKRAFYGGEPFSPRKLGYKISVYYLLIRIGIIGGVELASQPFSTVFAPSLLAVGMSIIFCLLVLTILMKLKVFDRETRVSLAIHFGSVSVGTFTVVLKMIEAEGMPFSPYVNSWVTLMELPSIFIGIFMLGGGFKAIKSLLEHDKSLILLPAALILGMLAGKYIITFPLFHVIFDSLFDIILAYFLFEMGRQASDTLLHLTKSGSQLILIGVGLPILGGTLGVILTTVLGFELGNRIIFGSLLASASYVAAPTAIRATIESNADKAQKANLKKAVNVSLATALGITLPFNLVFGIRLYKWEAILFENTLMAYIAIALLSILTYVMVFKGDYILTWMNTFKNFIKDINQRVLN